MREGVPAGDVVDKQSASRSSVVGARDALEGLLAGRIPDLQLDVLPVDLDRACSELHSDCEVVLLAEPLVRKLQQ